MGRSHYNDKVYLGELCSACAKQAACGYPGGCCACELFEGDGDA
jgi:hypothetical protein